MEFKEEVLSATLGKTYLFSVGQAGYIIKSAKGELLAIDLYLSDSVEKLEGHVGFKRLLPKILSPTDIVFDCVIATHPHYDHFDPDSIQGLLSTEKTQLFSSEMCMNEMLKIGLDVNRSIYVKPGDNVKVGGFGIHFVNCDHGAGAPDAVGVIVEVDGKIIYEAGDTSLRLDRISEYKFFGDIDVMIAPINGAYGNMNELECVEFAKELQPKITVPCHYGMFASHGGSPNIFYEEMKKNNMGDRFIFMRQGEKMEL